MMTGKLILSTTLLLASVLLAQAQASDALVLTCPATLNVTDSVSGLESGWQAVADAGLGAAHLANVTFYSGSPEQMASLVPDGEKKVKGGTSATWSFAKGDKDGYWLACNYDHTRMMATRKLPETVTQCTVTFGVLPNGKASGVKQISCN
jgi:hypothetical protein